MKKKKSVASQPETTQEEKSRPLKPAIEYFCTGKLLFWNLGNFHSISSLLRFSSNLAVCEGEKSGECTRFVRTKSERSPTEEEENACFALELFSIVVRFSAEKYSNTFPQTLFLNKRKK
jgi:hypothetical protein